MMVFILTPLHWTRRRWCVLHQESGCCANELVEPRSGHWSLGSWDNSSGCIRSSVVEGCVTTWLRGFILIPWALMNYLTNFNCPCYLQDKIKHVKKPWDSVLNKDLSPILTTDCPHNRININLLFPLLRGRNFTRAKHVFIAKSLKPRT